MSKTNCGNAPKQILDYLKNQNRPYSAIDIFNNMHKEISKAAVIKALDQLVSEGKIKEKVYGKQKIFFIDQTEFSQSENVDLAKLDAEINNLSFTYKDITQKIKIAEGVISGLGKSLTTEEAAAELSKLKKEIPLLQAKLKNLVSNNAGIKPEEKDTLKTMTQKYSDSSRKRKKMANEILDAILEGYPKSKKQLFEEIGIETD